jgi:transcriptional regulator with XRE-family HTH domain
VLSGHVDEICSHVARILRDERKQRGLSMTALAQKAGLSRAMISFVESEFRNPSLETLVRMAYVLDVNLAEIIQRAQDAVARKKRAR